MTERDRRRREILEELLKKQIGSLDIKPNIKPSHGSCCTCQVCGYSYEDCNCLAREAVKEIDHALTSLKELDRVDRKELFETMEKINKEKLSNLLGYGELYDFVDAIIKYLEGR